MSTPAVTFDAFETMAVARALAAVAAADGAVKAREEAFLEGFAMSAAQKDVVEPFGAHLLLSQPLDEEELASRIGGPEKRRQVVRLCLQMAVVDGDYADAERAMVTRIARALQIAEPELAALTDAALAARPAAPRR